MCFLLFTARLQVHHCTSYSNLKTYNEKLRIIISLIFKRESTLVDFAPPFSEHLNAAKKIRYLQMDLALAAAPISSCTAESQT